MKRSVLLSLVFATTVAASPQAHAGGVYVGLGVGSAHVEGDAATLFDTEGKSSGRLMLGKRFGDFALEGVLFGTDLRAPTLNPTSDAPYSALTFGLEGKYHLALLSRLELYVKGGLTYTSLHAKSEAMSTMGDLSGRGYDYGVGVQYTFRTPTFDLAVWLDITRQVFRLSDVGSTSLGGGFSMATIGLSIGSF